MTLNMRSFFVRIIKHMVLAELNPLQIIFVIATPIVLIFIVLFFIVIPINKKHIKKNFVEYCYKAIYKIAFDEDYYLINNFLFRVDSTKVAKIDHILFGNKYIYVILDAFFEGNLTGKEGDQSLIVVNNKSQRAYTENQYNVSKKIVEYLVRATGMDNGLFIGVVVVNNDCKISVETTNKQYYIIQRNKLKRLVRAIESRDVGKINAAQLDAAVKAIDKLNRTKKKK